MTKNARLLLFALVEINTLVLFWLLLKGPITSYWRKLEIKSRAHLGNITVVALGCQDFDTKGGLRECGERKEAYRYLEVRFNGLIDGYNTVTCNLFSDKNEAQQFYEYVGGINTLNSIKNVAKG